MKHKLHKLLSVLMAMAMLVSLMPAAVFAADTAESVEDSIIVTVDEASDAAEASTEVTEPAADANEPSTEVAEPAADANEPSTEATEPAADTVEPSTEVTEPAAVCDCGTDDPAIHAVTCGVYAAPENPVCCCAEKCTEANIWCDVCGVDFTQCSGTDTAAVYENIVASGDCSAEGSNVQWKYDDTGTLTISGTGAMDSYSSNQQPWYAYMESITAVVVEDGVTVVAGNSFDSFTSLQSVTIADSVVELGLQAFRACTNLVSVRLSSNLARIGQSAFRSCKSLTSIELPQSVTFMNYSVFAYCTSLTSIEIPSGVTELKSSMFEQCTNLTSVTLPDTLTKIGPSAFTYCTSLASIEIPNSVTELGDYAFDGCTSLASIEIPDSVIQLGKGVFWGCTALTEIKLPNALQTIPTYAFWDCSNLKDITIPAGVTSVHYTAFTGIAASPVVHYLGTEAEYNTVFSEVLTKAAKHYCVEKDETLPVCNEPGHEKGWYCDTCAKYVDGGAETTRDPDNHAFSEKSICTRCGAYEAPALENGYYEIGNMGQMFWFANYINTVDRTASAVLTADIDLENRPWTPIGSTGEDSNNFRGVFDGQNHTIKGLYVEGGRAGLGFFGEVRTGTVKNFTIYGEVVANTDVNYVGGVFGSICGLNSTDHGLERNGAVIQNITSYVNLTAKTHGIGMIGGFVGYANHQSLIENCAWYGTFDAGEYRVDSGAGGFIGRIYDTATVTIRNCGAYGDIITAYKSGTSGNYDTIYIGGFLSYSPSGAKTVLANNLWAGEIINNTNLDTANAHLSAYGTLNSEISTTNCYALDNTLYVTTGNENTTGITTVTAEQLKSGEIAYKLQEGDEIWGQNIGTQNYPVLGGDKVYQVKNCKQEIAYSNSTADIGHNYANGICTVCDEACEHTGGTATCTTLAVCDICGVSYGEVDTTNHDETVAYVNGFCPNGCYEPAVRNGNVYEISNAGQLYWFAAQVNGGKNSDAKLTANIVVNENVLTADGELNGDGSEFRHWTPIGNEDVSYYGTFDGNGYTVSGLYFNDSTINCVGLFGEVFGGTVKHVGVIDSYLKGGKYVGGVVGQNTYATVENCYNSGTVIGTEYVGGVVGDNSETVQNCHNAGVVSGTEYVGGVVGFNSDTVQNCHNTGVVSGKDSVGGVVGYNWGTAQNCYNTGTVEGYDYVSSVGGVVGFNLKTVQNCYNTGTIKVISSSADAGGVVGYNWNGTVTNTYNLDTVPYGGINGENVEGQAEAKTAEQFASGEVAYLLQGEQTEQVWGQTIDTDAYPVLGGATVYYGYDSCAEDAGMAYSNEPLSAEKPDHDYVDGTCKNCGFDDPSIPKYTLTVSEADNGTVTAEKPSYAEGKAVTLTISPAEGYALESLTVDGTDVTAQVQNGTYTFTMPAKAVTVTAVFAKIVYYDLWIGGTQVASNNLTISGSSGTAVYDPAANTLTLNEYTYADGYHEDYSSYTAAIYCGTDSLKLVLNGDSTVVRTDTVEYLFNCGIYAKGNIEILDGDTEGIGSLTVTAGMCEGHNNNSYGLYVVGSLTVNGGTLTANGGKTDSSYGAEADSITILGGSLTGVGGEADSSYGVSADTTITVNGGSLTGIGHENGDGYGVFAVGAITVDGGTLTGIGGNDSYSYGVFTGSSITVNSGTLKATCGTAENSYGVKTTSGLKLGSGISMLTPVGGRADNDKNTIVDAEGNIATTVEIGTCTGHSFSDGKCAVCGKELFYGTNMTLGNELDLNFALETDIVPDGAYAIITRSYADDTSVTATIEKAKWTKQGSLSLITYEGLAAKEMCDKVSVTVYDKDRNALGTREDSIRSYAMRCIKDDTGKYSKEVKVLLMKMLDYGAQAQNEFKHNTGDLANKEITEQMRTDYPFEKQTVTNKGSAVAGQYMGTSLILKTRIEMQMGFYGDPTNVTATVSYTDHYGTQKTFSGTEVKIATYTDTETEEIVAYGVIIPSIVVGDARQEVTVTVTPAGGEAITVKDSIASYAARHDSAGVYGAIMDFSDAALAYFKTQTN